MTGVKCEEYLADPAAFESHLDSCESCRAAAAELERLDRGISRAAGVDPGPSTAPANLPLAPWEGARQRSWGPVIAVGALVAILGAIAFLIVGISPLDGFLAAMTSSLPGSGLGRIVRTAPNLLAKAPLGVHILIFVSFIVVNVIFVALLRRRTKGYDVSSR